MDLGKCMNMQGFIRDSMYYYCLGSGITRTFESLMFTVALSLTQTLDWISYPCFSYRLKSIVWFYDTRNDWIALPTFSLNYRKLDKSCQKRMVTEFTRRVLTKDSSCF